MHTTSLVLKIPADFHVGEPMSINRAFKPLRDQIERGVPDDDLRAAEQCSNKADHRQGQHRARDRKGAMLKVASWFFLHLGKP